MTRLGFHRGNPTVPARNVHHIRVCSLWMCELEPSSAATMNGGYELLKETGDLPSPPVRRGNRRVVFSVLIASAVLLSGFYAFWPKVQLYEEGACQSTSASPLEAATSSPQPLKQCAASVPQPAEAPAPVNIWASLSVGETVEISEWLNAPSRGLNLTSAAVAALSDNFIFHIEAWRPSKADALHYLESPSKSNLPERFARATVQLGGRSTEEGGPVVKDYLVGPLPISDKTAMRELTEVYHRPDIPFNARGFAIPTELTSLLMTYMPRLAPITKVSVKFVTNLQYIKRVPVGLVRWCRARS